MKSSILTVILSIVVTSVAQSDPISVHFDFYLGRNANWTVTFLEKLTNDQSLAISHSCRSSLVDYMDGIKSRRRDAIRLLDSTAFPTSGSVIRINDFGHYSQCLETKLNGGINPRYVMVSVDWPELPFKREDYNITYGPSGYPVVSLESGSWSSEVAMSRQQPILGTELHAVCLPSTCHQSDIQVILDSRVVTELVAPMKLSVWSTETKDEDQFADIRVVRIFARVFLVIYFGLIVLGTCFASADQKFLNCFNISGHHTKFMTVNQPDDDRLVVITVFKAFGVINGLISHTFLVPSMLALSVQTATASFVRQNFFLTIHGVGFLMISNVFIFSGCQSYILLHKQFSKITLMSTIIMKALVYIPCMTFMMIIMAALPVVEFGQGPLFAILHVDQVQRCLDYGWANLLFVSNWVDVVNHCFVTNWMISVDMQLLICSWLSMYVLSRSKKWGFVLLAIQVVLAITLNIVSFWKVTQFPLTGQLTLKTFSKLTQQFDVTQTHISGLLSNLACYPIGILLGWLIVNDRKDKKINWTATILSIIVLRYSWNMGYEAYDLVDGSTWMPRFVEVFVGSSLRFWILASITSLIYFFNMRLHNHSNILAQGLVKLAKQPIFYYISKLVFPVALTQLVFINDMIGRRTQIKDMIGDHVVMVTAFLVLSLGSAYLLVILVDYPTRKLIAYFTGRERIKKSD